MSKGEPWASEEKSNLNNLLKQGLQLKEEEKARRTVSSSSLKLPEELPSVEESILSASIVR